MKNLSHIIQSYLGMTPKDKCCENWTDMQSLMEEEINNYFKQNNLDSEQTKPIEGEDNPYPLSYVLELLVKATVILLHKKDYDGYDYEEMNQAVIRGKEIIHSLSQPSGPVESAEEILNKAVSIIKKWHGKDAWDIYYNNSPEMKPIRDLSISLKSKLK